MISDLTSILWQDISVPLKIKPLFAKGYCSTFFCFPRSPPWKSFPEIHFRSVNSGGAPLDRQVQLEKDPADLFLDPWAAPNM